MPANVLLDPSTAQTFQNLYTGVAWYTEIAQTPTDIDSFQIAGTTPGGNSSYAFGILQFNIGSGNSAVNNYLLANGFNQTQINQLGGTTQLSLAALNTDDSILYAAINIPPSSNPSSNLGSTGYNNLVANTLSQYTNYVQTDLDSASPTILSALLSSPTAIMRLYDMANQFGGSSSTIFNSGALLSFLGGDATTFPHGGDTISYNYSESAPDNLQAAFFATSFGAITGANTRNSAFYDSISSLNLPNIVVDITPGDGSNPNFATFGNLQDVTLNLANGTSASDGSSSSVVTFTCGSSTATVNGLADVTCSNSTLTVDASNASVFTSGSSDISVVGTNNQLTINPGSSGGAFNFSSGSSSTSSGTDTITDDSNGGNTIDTGSAGDYDFSGVGDTLNNFLAATANLSIVNGSGFTINISGSSSTDINGPDTVNINPVNADNLDLFSAPVTFNTGTGTPFSPSQLAILNGFNGGLSNVTMNSNTDAAYSGSNQNVNIAGTNITASGISGGNVQTIGSAQAVLSGTNTAFKISAGSTTTINGSNDTSSITGSNTTLTQEGGGVVDVLGSSNVNSITGNNLNIYESQNAVIEAVYGNNNTVHITGGGGSKSQVADAAISGSPITTDVFAPGGTGNTVSYDTFGSGSYGGYGFSEAPPTSGTNIGLIASYDAQLGDQSDASTALSAKLEAQSNVSSSSSTDTHANTPEFEGVKWASQTITWSLATTYDPVGAQLSGLIGSQYLPLIQQAFHDWSVLSGLQFKQVAAAASPDIELGWSTFNPAVTGVLGYTGFRVINGAIQSGALISLENPTDDALAKDASGQLAYTGTQTELEQLLLHQIGQALGLADDADTKSIMYAVLSSKNRFFDATDMAGIQDLYDSSSVASPASTTVASDATTLSGSSPISVSASLVSNLSPSALTPFASEANQLINAMAVFNPSASPTTAYTPPTLASLASSMTLSASGH